MAILHYTNEERNEWDCYSHNPIQILPATGFLAVYHRNEPDGTVSLYAEVPLFLALCSTTRSHYRRRPGQNGPDLTEQTKQGNEIVPLYLEGGMFMPVTDLPWYCGIVRDTDPLWNGLAYMGVDDRKKLRPEFRHPDLSEEH